MMSASNLHNGPKSDIVRGPKSATSRLMHRSNQRYSMISSARSPIRGLALNRSAVRSNSPDTLDGSSPQAEYLDHQRDINHHVWRDGVVGDSVDPGVAGAQSYDCLHHARAKIL